MSRPLQPIDGGLVYHVINRGNNRQPAFHDEGDYVAFFNAVTDLEERQAFDLYGYCLMGNHTKHPMVMSWRPFVAAVRRARPSARVHGLTGYRSV